MGQQEAHDTGSTWVQRIVVGPSFSQKCARESYAAGGPFGSRISPGALTTIAKKTRGTPGTWQAGMGKAMASERARASPVITGHHRFPSRRCEALGNDAQGAQQTLFGYGGEGARCRCWCRCRRRRRRSCSAHRLTVKSMAGFGFEPPAGGRIRIGKEFLRSLLSSLVRAGGAPCLSSSEIADGVLIGVSTVGVTGCWRWERNGRHVTNSYPLSPDARDMRAGSKRGEQRMGAIDSREMLAPFSFGDMQVL